MMNRTEMREVMMSAFKSSIFNHYVENGWIIPSDFNSFSFGIERIHRDKSPSFDYRGLWVGVDFAAGAGSKVGLPTNQKHITVYFEKHGKYHHERFTFKQFIDELWKKEKPFETNEQLVLF